MSFIASETSQADFTPAPAGVWPGRLYRLIDIGTVHSEWQGKPTSSRKILLSFELLDAEAVNDDGKPLSVHRRFTLSLGKKAALRAFLESLLGRPFTDEQLRGYDLRKLLGVGALLNITHDSKGDKVFANLQSATPPPRGYVIPPAVNAPLTFDCDAPDLAVLEQLGKSLKAQIEASPEFLRAMKPTSGPQLQVPGDPDFDDDIPF
jgi:hypothetical protein